MMQVCDPALLFSLRDPHPPLSWIPAWSCALAQDDKAGRDAQCLQDICSAAGFHFPRVLLWHQQPHAHVPFAAVNDEEFLADNLKADYIKVSRIIVHEVLHCVPVLG